MIPHIRLAPNPDGTYDILVEYTRADVELAADFDVERNLKADSKSLSSTMRSYAKKAKINSVKILVSGALVATIAFGERRPLYHGLSVQRHRPAADRIRQSGR